MAAYISFQPTDFFNTKLYTGTGAELAITGVGFQPDWVWLKSRSGASNSGVYDSVRGVENGLASNLASGQNTSDTGLEVFGSDGFTLGTNGNTNASGTTYASWNWKMGTTSGISGGTITPSSYSLNTTAGQSIIAYTGTGSNATVPHGLGVAPKMIIVKRLNASDNWNVGHSSQNSGTDAWDYTQKLNNDSAKTDDNTIWNDTAPTSSVFSIGTSTEVNTNTSTYIAYCFAEIKGYSKFGEYKGNGNADGPFIYTGFRPNWVLIKSHTNASRSWFLFDGANKGYNVTNCVLKPNETAAEDCATFLDILSNGFKIRNTNSPFNQDTSLFIYAAFAEFPFVSSNSKAGTAR